MTNENDLIRRGDVLALQKYVVDDLEGDTEKTGWILASAIAALPAAPMGVNCDDYARLRYVLDGVLGAIKTQQYEPLQIWKEQAELALSTTAPALTPPPATTLGDALDALNPTATERDKAAQIIRLMRTVQSLEMAEALAVADKLTLAEALELPEIEEATAALAQSLSALEWARIHLSERDTASVAVNVAIDSARAALAALKEKGGDA